MDVTGMFSVHTMPLVAIAMVSLISCLGFLTQVARASNSFDTCYLSLVE